MLTRLQIPTLLLFTVAVYGQTPESRIPVLSPGVHNQRLPRTGERTIQYAISIPANYSPSRPVPLVLALHYGGNPNGAGRGVLTLLVGPALAELGAIIVAPDSIGGGWNTPENERAVRRMGSGLKSTRKAPNAQCCLRRRQQRPGCMVYTEI